MLRCLLAPLLVLPLFAQPGVNVTLKPGRDPNQPIDEEYTKKIREYTTEKFFNSPLTDYLPASKTVPTPKAVLGDVAGAPGILPYSYEVYKYMRMLEAATPRVKVFSIGKTEEGREMIAVAVASEKLIAQLDQNRARLAQLADPRTINFNDDTAEKLIAASTPIYYITGTIHSTETGAPTALMELAYRLAVDDSAYIKFIRENVITLITPIVEVDGRDRMVDIYRWHLAHPGKEWPNLIYWGHYVAHDNNRDAMGLTLDLTKNILNTFVGWKAQVLHDLHESVPYLYDNTIGDGPYNAWIDPMLADEWQMMGWNNVSEMTKFGMPGVFTHGTFDTWSPSYLMFIAATHNGISRLYETFGNGGADTEERTLRPNEYARTWFKQNPPLPKAKWSQRNNNNYEETGVLTGLAYFSANNKLFLRNFYIKAKRSIEKPKTEGPAAYVFTADDPRPGAQADLLQMLQEQGCEISRATASFTVMMPAKKPRAGRGGRGGGASGATDGTDGDTPPKPPEKPKPEPKTFPAGTYVLRMDQPYSRIADTLLDYQYWATDDPQKSIYDDTGWTFGELGNVQVTRVTDIKVLDAPMTKVSGPVLAPGGVEGSGSIFLINNNTDSGLISLRYRLANASFDAAEEPFEAAGHKFNRGSFIVRNVQQGDLDKAGTEFGIRAYAVDTAPSVKTHPIRAARIAIMHTWLNTQAEGWWRVEFDRLKIPYAYFSTQTVAKEDNLRDKYDVIIFAPGAGGNAQTIVSGRPMYGNPLPWKVTKETPNLAKTDETDDMRPGLGWSGVDHLQKFVEQGGLFITANDTTGFAISIGFAPGVSTSNGRSLKVTGSAVRSKIVDAESPILYGYSDNFAIFASNPPIFSVSNMAGGGGGGGGRGGAGSRERPTGRGTADDPDIPQGRPIAEIPDEPRASPWEAAPVTDEQLRNPVNLIPPAARPRVVLRYGDAQGLLVSGLLDSGGELAQRPAVIDASLGQGHVVLFSNNPFWRAETKGSYFLVFNAILNFDHLSAGRKLASK